MQLVVHTLDHLCQVHSSKEQRCWTIFRPHAANTLRSFTGAVVWQIWQLGEAVRILNLWHLWTFAGPEPTFDKPLAQAHQMDVVRSSALAGTRVPTVFGGYSVVDSLLAAPT